MMKNDIILTNKDMTKCAGCINATCAGCEFLATFCRRHGELDGLTPNQSCKKYAIENEAKIPTIKDLVDIWYPKYAKIQYMKTTTSSKIGYPRPYNVKRLASGIRRSAEIAGISLDEKITAVTKKRLSDGIIGWHYEKKSKGQSVSDATVAGYLSVWSSLTCRWIRELADNEGIIVIPKVEVPKFRIEQVPWKKPSELQMKKYENWVKELEAEHSAEWAMTIFQRATGCRNRDVNSAKWENFSIRESKCVYTYVDSKTQKKSAQVVPLALFDNLLSWRKWYFSKDGPVKAFRKGHEDDPYIFGGKLVDGKFIPTMKNSIWRRISKGMKACGICDNRTDTKGAYQNRALRAQELLDEYGEDIMTRVLHNSKKVAMRYSEFDPVAKMEAK